MSLREAVEKYLADNDPEGFGCACTPKTTCGPCWERRRQAPLYQALRAAPTPPLRKAASALPPSTAPEATPEKLADEASAERNRCAAICDDEARIRTEAGRKHPEGSASRDRCFAGARAAINCANGIRSGAAGENKS